MLQILPGQAINKVNFISIFQNAWLKAITPENAIAGFVGSLYKVPTLSSPFLFRDVILDKATNYNVESNIFTQSHEVGITWSICKLF